MSLEFLIRRETRLAEKQAVAEDDFLLTVGKEGFAAAILKHKTPRSNIRGLAEFLPVRKP